MSPGIYHCLHCGTKVALRMSAHVVLSTALDVYVFDTNSKAPLIFGGLSSEWSKLFAIKIWCAFAFQQEIHTFK